MLHGVDYIPEETPSWVRSFVKAASVLTFIAGFRLFGDGVREDTLRQIGTVNRDADGKPV